MVDEKRTLHKRKRSLFRSEPILFFLSPKFKNPKISFRRKFQLLKVALKFEFKWLLLWMSFLFVDMLIAQLLKTKPIIITALSGHHGFKGLSNEKLILLAVFVAPIVEELAFRGFMNFKKLLISLSASFFTISFLRMIFRSYFEWWGLLAVAIVVFFLSFLLLKREKVYSYIITKRVVLFYSMSILFALAHLNNFTASTFSGINFILIPCLVFPQFIGSVSLAYIRLKNGLAWSMAVHAFVNLIIVTVYILGHPTHS
jgi:membrane protease YdiL (CAAX protease family)